MQPTTSQLTTAARMAAAEPIIKRLTRKLLRGRKGEWADAEQHARLALLEALPTFDSSREFEPWAGTVIFRSLVDFGRSLNTAKHRNDSLSDDIPAPAIANDLRENIKGWPRRNVITN